MTEFERINAFYALETILDEAHKNGEDCPVHELPFECCFPEHENFWAEPGDMPWHGYKEEFLQDFAV